eukprot:10436336-Karenia_brevis.AAC.1
MPRARKQKVAGLIRIAQVWPTWALSEPHGPRGPDPKGPPKDPKGLLFGHEGPHGAKRRPLHARRRRRHLGEYI